MLNETPIDTELDLEFLQTYRVGIGAGDSVAHSFPEFAHPQHTFLDDVESRLRFRSDLAIFEGPREELILKPHFPEVLRHLLRLLDGKDFLLRVEVSQLLDGVRDGFVAGHLAPLDR